MLDHAGQLHHPPQRGLSPTAAYLRRAQGCRKRDRLPRQLLQLFFEPAEHLLPRGLDFPRLRVQPPQRFAQRAHHALNGGLLLGQISADLCANGIEGGPRGLQKRRLVGSQRGIRQRLESLLDLGRRGFRRCQPRLRHHSGRLRLSQLPTHPQHAEHGSQERAHQEPQRKPDGRHRTTSTISKLIGYSKCTREIATAQPRTSGGRR